MSEPRYGSLGSPLVLSPMAQMSRAIRETVEGYASTLQELDDDTLLQFSQIVSAFSLDLRDELKRRGEAT